MKQKPILILLASKGRPQKIEGFYKSWKETTEGYSEVLTCLDNDDPELKNYRRHKDVQFDIGEGKSLNGTCNRAFFKYPNYKYYFIVSDDHRLRSKYWESTFMNIIEKNVGKGVAYGNDLMYGDKLATSTFVSGNIFRALGYLTLPGLYHMWIDKFYVELGREINKLFYFPDVYIEHLHFSVNKSIADESYLKVNNSRVYNHDRLVFEDWYKNRRIRDGKTILSYRE